MGEATIRITVQDFVTPPELAGFQLAAEGAGRIGGVRLEVIGQPTRLAGCYQQVPLRVLPLTFGPAQPLLVYLLNPTAGLFDGDAQLVTLQAGPGTRTFLTSQSATRIHPCLHGFSTQHWQVRVAAGAILVVLPGPAIPFQGCRYFQRATVDLQEGAHLIWGDLWLAGRYARGANSERFQFQTLVQELTVRRSGRLVYRDRFCWEGPWDDDTAAWHFGGYAAYGSLFTTVASAKSPDHPQVKQACFKTAAHDTCFRWLGPVQDVTCVLTRLALTLAARADGFTEPWLLAAHDLAPTHWFSSQEDLT